MSGGQSSQTGLADKAALSVRVDEPRPSETPLLVFRGRKFGPFGPIEIAQYGVSHKSSKQLLPNKEIKNMDTLGRQNKRLMGAALLFPPRK